MVEERDLIEDWQQGRLIPEEVPLEVVDSLAALASHPLAADPNLGMMRIAQRIDELIQLVGRMAHSDLTTIPASNISTRNLTATAQYLQHTEQKMNEAITHLQANMHQAEQQLQHLYYNNNNNTTNNKSTNNYSKSAAESKALHSIKPLSSY